MLQIEVPNDANALCYNEEAAIGKAMARAGRG
jgi:hypothetical protein